MVFDKKAVRKNFAIFIGKHLEYCNILRPPILKNIFVRTARNVSKYGVISGTYFPVFGLNTERYSGIIRYLTVFSPNTGKYGPEIAPYLDTFHEVTVTSQVTLGSVYLEGYFWRVAFKTILTQ